MNGSLKNHLMKVSSVLRDEEIEEVMLFFKQLNFQSHYNNPYWIFFVEPYKKPIYIRFYKNAELAGFAIVYIRMSFCVLKFGPLAINDYDMPEYINEIINYLKQEKYGLLTVQLPLNSNSESNLLLLDDIKSKYKLYFENEGWTTLMISLEGKTSEDIFKLFSKGHKSAIKKAIKEEVEIRIIKGNEHLKVFSAIYSEMHLRKGLIPSLPDPESAFESIFNLKLGTFAGVYKSNELIGGVLFVSEGSSLLYKFGASNIKYNNIPILHLAIFEMIKFSIDQGYKYVDLGGVDPAARQGSYTFGINTFKKGFGGEEVICAPSFSVKLNRIKYYFVNITLFVGKLLPKSLLRQLYALKS
jgi:hypothetical protein